MSAQATLIILLLLAAWALRGRWRAAGLLLAVASAFVPIHGAGQYWPWIVCAACFAGVLASKGGELAGFAAFASAVGIGYVFLLPPLQVPDELQHLIRARQIADGGCMAPLTYDYPASLADLDRAFPPAVEVHRTFGMSEVEGWRAVGVGGRVERMRGNPADLYHCAAYLPQVAGLWLSDGSVLGALRAARVAGLIVYLLLVGWAWWLLPPGRLTFLGVAGLPMALHQASGVTADTVSNGLCFVLAAYILRLAWHPKVAEARRSRIVWLFVLTALASLVKLTFWMALTAVLIPAERCRRQVVWALIAVALLTTVAWNTANRARAEQVAEQRLKRGIDVARNLEYARREPVALAGAVVSTAINKTPEWLGMFVGRMGFGSIALPSPVILGYLMMLLFLAATEAGCMAPWQRAYCVVWTLAGTALLLVMLFLLEARGPGEIPGFQGRYWIPFALVALSSAGGLLTVAPRIRTAVLGGGLVVANAAALRAIESRYYREPAPGLRIALVPDIQIDNRRTNAPAPPLPRAGRWGQSFRARRDGLAGVDVLFATYQKTIPGGAIRMTLHEDYATGPVLAESRIPAQSIADNVWTGLRFEPRAGSKGKLYYLDIDDEGLPPGYPITVWIGPGEIYAGGDFHLDGRPEPHDLAFRTFYRP